LGRATLHLYIATGRRRASEKHAALMRLRSKHYALYLAWCDLHAQSLLSEPSAITELEKRPEFKDILQVRKETNRLFKIEWKNIERLEREAVDHIDQITDQEVDALNKARAP
jgi:hypothetical protein